MQHFFSAMYGSWTENVVLWRNFFLGYIWDLQNVLMMYDYWLWALSRCSKSLYWLVTFWESIFFNYKRTTTKNVKKKLYNKLFLTIHLLNQNSFFFLWLLYLFFSWCSSPFFPFVCRGVYPYIHPWLKFL